MLRKVYVVDDDRMHSKLLAANLGQPGQIRVEIFEQPEPLYARCQEEPPDAVITDLLMPGTSGVEVTRTLRQRDPRAPSKPSRPEPPSTSPNPPTSTSCRRS
jgi:CheY-like chemotaxis protein